MRYRLRELCRLYLPWLFACLCVFACPPREHSSSLSLSLSLYYYSISLSRCIVLSLFWLSVSFYRYFVAHKPLQFTHRNTARWIRIRRERIKKNRFWATRSFRIHANPSRYHLLVSLSLFLPFGFAFNRGFESIALVLSAKKMSFHASSTAASHHQPPPPHRFIRPIELPSLVTLFFFNYAPEYSPEYLPERRVEQVKNRLR